MLEVYGIGRNGSAMILCVESGQTTLRISNSHGSGVMRINAYPAQAIEAIDKALDLSQIGRSNTFSTDPRLPAFAWIGSYKSDRWEGAIMVRLDFQRLESRSGTRMGAIVLDLRPIELRRFRDLIIALTSTKTITLSKTELAQNPGSA